MKIVGLAWSAWLITEDWEVDCVYILSFTLVTSNVLSHYRNRKWLPLKLLCLNQMDSLSLAFWTLSLKRLTPWIWIVAVFAHPPASPSGAWIQGTGQDIGVTMKQPVFVPCVKPNITSFYTKFIPPTIVVFHGNCVVAGRVCQSHADA